MSTVIGIFEDHYKKTLPVVDQARKREGSHIDILLYLLFGLEKEPL